MDFHVVVLAGDGIGPEIIGEAQRVLGRIGEVFGHKFKYEDRDAGGIAIEKTGQPVPDATLKACQNAQAVLKGPLRHHSARSASIGWIRSARRTGPRVASAEIATTPHPYTAMTRTQSTAPLPRVSRGITD